MSTPHFIGNVKAKWLRDGRKMKLIEDFSFVDANGKVWEAPKGSVVDGASIPRIFWRSVGPPFVGKYRRASVLHDVACKEQTEPHEDVHKMFYDAMLCDRTPQKKAKIMYDVVKTFGPKW
jgi:hypothetical protein